MQGGSYYNGGRAFNVDTTDLQRTINMLRGIMKPERFERLIYRTFGETGRRSRTIISREVARDYAVPQSWVRGGVGHYRVQMGGAAQVTCTIPLMSKKGIIGGRFRLRNARIARQTGVIDTQILRSGTSTLPAHLPARLGGNRPFVGGGSINGLVFARRYQTRLPIIRVVGVAAPQTALNQSADHVSDALLDLTWRRLEHNFDYMMRSGQ